MDEGFRFIAAALAVGIAAIGTGWAQSRIGSAGVGALAEKPDLRKHGDPARRDPGDDDRPWLRRRGDDPVPVGGRPPSHERRDDPRAHRARGGDGGRPAARRRAGRRRRAGPRGRDRRRVDDRRSLRPGRTEARVRYPPTGQRRPPPAHGATGGDRRGTGRCGVRAGDAPAGGNRRRQRPGALADGTRALRPRGDRDRRPRCRGRRPGPGRGRARPVRRGARRTPRPDRRRRACRRRRPVGRSTPRGRCHARASAWPGPARPRPSRSRRRSGSSGRRRVDRELRLWKRPDRRPSRPACSTMRPSTGWRGPIRPPRSWPSSSGWTTGGRSSTT